MGMSIFKRKPSAQELDDMQNIMKVLGEIYSNKSSDEFKCKGDIRKVPMYKFIDKQIADLSTLKKYPATDAKDIKTMFLTLHRPIFPQMVLAYLNKPDERNSLFTALFTVAYRVLVVSEPVSSDVVVVVVIGFVGSLVDGLLEDFFFLSLASSAARES